MADWICARCGASYGTDIADCYRCRRPGNSRLSVIRPRHLGVVEAPVVADTAPVPALASVVAPSSTATADAPKPDIPEVEPAE
jgi:uncharacterized OB-fold protein